MWKVTWKVSRGQMFSPGESTLTLVGLLLSVKYPICCDQSSIQRVFVKFRFVQFKLYPCLETIGPLYTVYQYSPVDKIPNYQPSHNVVFWSTYNILQLNKNIWSKEVIPPTCISLRPTNHLFKNSYWKWVSEPVPNSAIPMNE